MFYSRTKDIGNIQSVVVSKSAYQSGAVDYVIPYAI